MSANDDSGGAFPGSGVRRKSPADHEQISIFGLGTVVVDHQVVMEELPAADTKGEVITDRYQVGGPVPTALTLLRRLGMQATFLGRWADDPFGEMIERDLRAHGVKFDPPPESIDARTGFAHVWVEHGTGRRSIAAYRGSHPVDPDHVEAGSVGEHHALHLDGWSGEAAIIAATAMQERGGRVFLDLGSPKPRLDELLAHVDLLNCPARLIPRVFETDDLVEGARRFLAMGPKEVTVTSGEDGALYVSADCVIRQPAFPVEAVDTNGAGDVFAGAMIFASMRGWEPARRLRFASAASALKCRGLGNRDSLPDLQEIEAFLQKHPA
jgi:sugar/nucleoside kinase (ribokinase family)